MAQSTRPAASLYAVVRFAIAPAAAPSPAWIVPFTTPGPNPVAAVPGLTPRSPVTVVRPVLVTVEPANTAKSPADPRSTAVWPHEGFDVVKVHEKGAASGLPAVSSAPIVTVAA